MDKAELQKIFSNAYNHENWLEVLKTVFGARQLLVQPKSIALPANDIASGAVELGNITTTDDRIIGLYKVEVKSNVFLERNKVSLRRLLRDVYQYDVDGALIVFVQEKKWRFSFVSEIRTEDGKQETEPKRYTYLFGEGESSRTAAYNFEFLVKKDIKIQDLFEAFNVEKLNKQFFSEYQNQYEKFVLYLTGEKWNKKQNKYILTQIQEPSPLLKSAFYNDKKHARDFCKKLLGRIVFLHFLQKKGWMGCPVGDDKWENGRQQFMLELFNGFEDKNKFHSKCLTELFFNTLNKPDRKDVFKIEGLNNVLNGSKVPYLNGGLFETDSNCDPFKVDLPESYFKELLDFFGQYNFTIDENSPIDHEIGIDPEMLGHIFENLLEENKEKGAFYTPKEIVQYMTQESLIQYLQTYLGEHSELEQFIRYNEIGDRAAKHNYIRDNAAKIEELLDNVKICDPAIGSGAFPMGILTEIFEAKMALDMTLDRSDVKKKIIQNSIYGVDLDSGAVDIARLRFWLALVVDEDIPHALPNLDYKIMQGNSLLESFEGIDLSQIYKGKAVTIDDENTNDNLFSKVMDVQEVYNEEILENLIKKYFDLDDPIEKKKQHDIIDKQVLGKIYKCLSDEHEIIESEIIKLIRKIKTTSANLSNAEQKIKYESTSKESKNLKKLQNQISSIAQKQQKLKELYESNDRPFFLWHLMFQDVFKNGGFDIVIGNPPYVKVQNIENELSEVYKNKFSSATGKYDLYVLFIEAAFSLLNEKGNIIFINPHRFLIAEYGEGIKDIILKNRWLNKLLYFGVDQIFENATTYSGIFLFKKNSLNISYNQPKNRNLQNIEFTKIPYEVMGSSWLLTEDRNTISILKRINEFTSLSFYCEGVNQGIITTGDKIFMLSGKIEDDLFKGFSEELNCDVELEAVAVKPVLKGEDIVRYTELKSDRFVIYLHHEIKGKTVPFNEQFVRDNFPKVFAYLSNFKNDLVIKKIKYKTNPEYWFSLHRSRELDIILKPKKILTPQLQNKSSFTIDESGLFVPDAGGYIVALKPQYEYLSKSLLGILNSKLFYYFITKTSTPYNNNYYYFKTNYILPFKIPTLDDSEIKVLEFFVNSIIHLKKENDDELKQTIIFFEEIIDSIVLEIYFKDEFRSNNIEIFKFAQIEFFKFSETKFELDVISLVEVFERIQEKKNPLRNQIKLMKIELKQLLNPIISI